MNSALLAEKVGVHPTFISQVLKGHKDLNSEQWIAVCELVNLTDIEKDYLHLLLLLNRAGTPQARKYYQAKLNEILSRRLQLQERMTEHRQLSDQDRAVFYSSWIYSAMRVYTACGEGQTIEQLSEKFSISKEKTEEIMQFLTVTGLCKFDGGKFSVGDQHLHVPANSPHVIRHHTNWRLRALNSLEKTTPEEMNFTAPMSISKKDFQVLREKIVKLVQEVVDVVKTSEPEEVATLTIDLFWPIK